MPKMLCLDLDGTLLMPDLTIPQPVISALRELISRGVQENDTIRIGDFEFDYVF